MAPPPPPATLPAFCIHAVRDVCRAFGCATPLPGSSQVQVPQRLPQPPAARPSRAGERAAGGGAGGGAASSHGRPQALCSRPRHHRSRWPRCACSRRHTGASEDPGACFLAWAPTRARMRHPPPPPIFSERHMWLCVRMCVSIFSTVHWSSVRPLGGAITCPPSTSTPPQTHTRTHTRSTTLTRAPAPSRLLAHKWAHTRWLRSASSLCSCRGGCACASHRACRRVAGLFVCSREFSGVSVHGCARCGAGPECRARACRPQGCARSPHRRHRHRPRARHCSITTGPRCAATGHHKRCLARRRGRERLRQLGGVPDQAPAPGRGRGGCGGRGRVRRPLGTSASQPAALPRRAPQLTGQHHPCRVQKCPAQHRPRRIPRRCDRRNRWSPFHWRCRRRRRRGRHSRQCSRRGSQRIWHSHRRRHWNCHRYSSRYRSWYQSRCLPQ